MNELTSQSRPRAAKITLLTILLWIPMVVSATITSIFLLIVTDGEYGYLMGAPILAVGTKLLLHLIDCDSKKVTNRFGYVYGVFGLIMMCLCIWPSSPVLYGIGFFFLFANLWHFQDSASPQASRVGE